MVAKPIDGFNGCDDFFRVVLEGLVLVAAMEKFGMTSVQDAPSKKWASQGQNTQLVNEHDRRNLLESLCLAIVDSFTTCNFHGKPVAKAMDKVYLYEKYLLSVGLFYLEYADAIKEGDGTRVLRCWRYMLPMFVSSGKRNYAIESMKLLMQHDYLLSQREAAELIWSRFINVHGYAGRNISNDLHMEHLNRVVKTAIKGLGSNKTEECIARVGKALGTVVPILDNFDQQHDLQKASGNHSVARADKDLKLIIRTLQKASVFTVNQDRGHFPSFPNPRDPFHAMSHDELTMWMVNHINF